MIFYSVSKTIQMHCILGEISVVIGGVDRLFPELDA
jgi:hypothetical protein